MTEQTQSLPSQVAALAAMKDRLSPQSFARDHVSRLHVAADALAQIVSAKTGDDPVHRARRVSDASDRYLQSVGRSKAELNARELGGIESLHNQFVERVNLRTDGWRYASDVLAAFKGANQTEKAQMLGQIVEAGDGRSLAALLEAPQFVHGTDRDMLERYRDAMEARHAPDIAERREQFKQDIEAAQHALAQAERIAKDAVQVENVDEALAAAEQARLAESRLADATS